MKNTIFFLVIGAGAFYGYMWVNLNYIPDQQASQFVEEMRLQVDKAVIARQFEFKSPLPQDDITVPPQGISQKMTVTRQSGPGILDTGESRVITYLVKFQKSDQSPGQGRGEFEYRLVFKDEGSFILPRWAPSEFHPSNKKKRLKRG